MKIGNIRRQSRVVSIIHVIVKHGNDAVAFVGYRDAASFPVRHWPVAVARASERTVADHHGVQVTLGAVRDSEEITERRIDARCFVSVVINTQTQQARPAEFVVRNRYPDVRDHSGAGNIRHHQSFARKNPLAVVVAGNVAIAARNSVA